MSLLHEFEAKDRPVSPMDRFYVIPGPKPQTQACKHCHCWSSGGNENELCPVRVAAELEALASAIKVLDQDRKAAHKELTKQARTIEQLKARFNL